jgi:hypothetical protein
VSSTTPDASGESAADKEEQVESKAKVKQPGEHDTGAHTALSALRKCTRMTYFDAHPDCRPVLTGDDVRVHPECDGPAEKSRSRVNAGRRKDCLVAICSYLL